MFLGAGSAATGIADLMTTAFVDEGLTPDEARRHLWFVDVNGLVVKGRTDLADHNLPYAHDARPAGFVEAIDAVRPHVLIGATGAPGTFTQAGHRADERDQRAPGRLRAVESRRRRPSARRSRPTPGAAAARSSSSGSPFAPVTVRGQDVPSGAGQQRLRVSRHRPRRDRLPRAHAARRAVPRRGAHARRARAARDLDAGALYPPLGEIRRISLAIATSVAHEAYGRKLARAKRPAGLRRGIAKLMYEP